jgi:D-lyxose ketol-isomerase
MANPQVGLATQTPTTPGQSIPAIDVNMAGGYIVNPLAASDQGLATAEPLFINQVTSATTAANGTTIALQPGQSYTIIPNTISQVAVASVSASHKFTSVCWLTA